VWVPSLGAVRWRTLQPPGPPDLMSPASEATPPRFPARRAGWTARGLRTPPRLPLQARRRVAPGPTGGGPTGPLPRPPPQEAASRARTQKRFRGIVQRAARTQPRDGAAPLLGRVQALERHPGLPPTPRSRSPQLGRATVRSGTLPSRPPLESRADRMGRALRGVRTSPEGTERRCQALARPSRADRLLLCLRRAVPRFPPVCRTFLSDRGARVRLEQYSIPELAPICLN
jgi:hypothetical protein